MRGLYNRVRHAGLLVFLWVFVYDLGPRSLERGQDQMSYLVFDLLVKFF